MDKKFFERKVRQLSDDKLQDLLKLRYQANREIVDLAIDEAKKRGLELPDISVSGYDAIAEEQSDRKKLEKMELGSLSSCSFLDIGEQIGEMDDTNIYSWCESGCGDLPRSVWK